MSATFLKVAKRDTCTMLQVNQDGEDQWVECTKPVKGFAKKAFNEGDPCNLITDEEGVVTKIEKVGGGSSSGSSKSYSGSGKKSYGNKSSSEKSSGGSYSSTDKDASIIRQTVVKATAQTLVALQGHVDPNNVHELIDEIYKHLHDKVTE